MSTPRIAARHRVQALIRTAQSEGLMAAVTRSGEAESGLIWVLIDRFSAGVELIVEGFGTTGDPIWYLKMPAGTSVADARDAIDAEARFDADLWVVEVEDPHGRYVFPETVHDQPDPFDF